MFGSLEPLTEGEVHELKVLLRESGSASLDYARGIFTAISWSPRVIEASVWFPWVMGPDVSDKATLRRMFGLLMRDAKSIEDCLVLGEPWFPVDEDVPQFCKGLVRATQHADTWKTNPDVFLKLLPFAAVAGYVSLESISKVIGSAETDAGTWIETEQTQLRRHLIELYQALSPQREAARQASSHKIGRNQACPCGSGKKFKKCCAH